ncbi:MAG: UDP-3-O-acyl-N-acetylglucosamine deacetylase [Phycisphaerales bacterium]|nr:UDP-3-O-acyl-N-acetylglucosamine deacetylase [Phycisphaerales bacterium]
MIAHPRARKTIASTASVSGTGLFTNEPCTLTFNPSDRGLTLTRTDIDKAVPVQCDAIDASPVHSAFESLKGRSTNLARGRALAATVEHALSALAGLGITDCHIEIDAPEVPILDGSAKPFTDALQASGLADIDGTLEPITPSEAITIEAPSGPGRITIEPREEPGWSVAYELDYGASAHLQPQRADWDGSASMYTERVAPARTYSLDHEARALQAAGLFPDLTPADMLVIGRKGPIDNAYRFEHEPAAHKLLDAIGDISLAGRPIQANIVCHRSGHELNHRAAHALSTLEHGAARSTP